MFGEPPNDYNTAQAAPRAGPGETAAAVRVMLETNALHTSRAGIARYVRGLLRGLQAVDAPHVSWQTMAWEVDNFSYRQPQRALKTLYRELVWLQLQAPRLLRRSNANVLHSTGVSPLRAPPQMRRVATLYDAAVLAHPERFRPWHRSTSRRALSQLRRADAVLAISRFTAEEAIRRLGLDEPRLHVVHLGCDFHPAEPLPAEQAPDFRVPPEFFLFVGSLEPGKNLALLREAYLAAQDSERALPPLLIVGARWEGVPGEGAPPRDWQYLGHQPDAVLVHLYRRAQALLFPSRYEGFGLPVAEAMALGCPVICSPVASIPEVAGNAALYADQSSDDYLRRMRELLASPALRAEHVAHGLEQCLRFSWRRCAEETIAVYEEAAAMTDHGPRVQSVA